MSLETLNSASPEAARDLLRQCCTSDLWVERMTGSRPFANADSLRKSADKHWKGLDEGDYLQAFDGHPKIGNVSSLKAKYAKTKSLAAGEQSSVNTASDEIIDRLAAGNTNYENKFGFIFIVCASGKSAAEMVDLLEKRLPNTRSAELLNAAEEQRLIFQIRIEKML